MPVTALRSKLFGWGKSGHARKLKKLWEGHNDRLLREELGREVAEAYSAHTSSNVFVSDATRDQSLQPLPTDRPPFDNSP